DELAGPELELPIRKFSLQLQGTGRRIDLIVDADQLAGIDNCRSVVSEYIDFEGALRHCCIHTRNLLLRKAELHSDGLKLRNDDKSGRIGRMDDVAPIDLTQARAAR